MPHGPANAVPEAAPAIIQPSAIGGAAVILMSSGWPISDRAKSGSGPFAPILRGVWQSWQPPALTMYFPLATRAALTSPAEALDTLNAVTARMPTIAADATNVRMNDRDLMTCLLNETNQLSAV